MPLVATRGAASAQGFGEFARVTPPIYIEDVFSTYLYNGTGSTQTITNGIDVSGKGGLVWIKKRTFTVVGEHRLFDTARTANGGYLVTNNTGAQSGSGSGFSFDSTGFTYGYGNSGETLVSWTFRKQAKFFDVVTYTGNSTARTISHNLGSVPGCIIVKATSAAGYQWPVYHRSLVAGNIVWLNLTDASTASSGVFTTTAPTSTVFSLGAGSGANDNGVTYVAYLFAHDAGGFGASGNDNVISCGSYTGNGNSTSPPNIELGWEPQWILLKESSGIRDWVIVDNMRGLGAPSSVETAVLNPNLSNAESAFTNGVTITATGFQPRAAGIANLNGSTNIYIAIRRGPMKTPTSGTSVFSPNATTATTGTVITPNFPVDAQIIQYRTPAGGNVLWQDRLRGVNTTTTENNNPVLTSNDTSAESSTFASTRAWSNTGFQIASALTGQNRIYWSFRRAPGFFDEVCYTGDGTNMTINHNLGVIPELMIVKRRSITGLWFVYSSGTTIPNNYYLRLEDTGAQANAGSQVWNNTATTFLAGTGLGISASTQTYVAYLFATVAGVSKVGSYTGTGALQTINCGFAAGARFVLIKRTDSTGDWYVWDSARGISSSTDPYLTLNTTAAEVTSTNWVDTASTGFQVTAAGGNLVNTNGGTYIFLAIA